MNEPFYIKVRVKTKQKKEEIINKGKDSFEVSLKEKAEQGAANKRLLEILNNHYSYPMGGITIINGHHNPIKLLKVGK
jgi:uncharacterized protein YggU (UPF0235/DUF167 family)